MKSVNTEITINNIVLQLCESIEIESSWDLFTDTATIVIPNIIFQSKNENTTMGLDSLIKKGDPVKIKAGYNKPPELLPILFEGFVSATQNGKMIIVNCEDYMYVLKQKNIQSKFFENVTLGELIDYITNGINIEKKLIDSNIELGDWSLENNSYISPVQVLKKLKEDYGFVSYFKDKILNIGMPYDASGNTHYLLKELNIIEDNLSAEKNDTLVVLKGVSILPDNSSIILYAYRDGETITISESEIQGELRTLNFYNLSSEAMAENLKRLYQKTNFTGLSGNLTTFGEPVIKFNDWLKIRDIKNKERDGTYKVKGVKTSLSVSGGLRQEIEIDFSITDIEANS